jgi:RNA polymerase sigma-70 factor (ECF subfamily)
MSSNAKANRIPATSTSRSLLDQLRDDQPAAWQRLTSLYAPLVYHWCRRMGLPEQEMPDVFQQVFQAVASHIQSFERDRPGDTFRGWLRTITRNKVRDHFRRGGRQPQAVGGTDVQVYFSQLADPLAGEDAFVDSNEAFDASGSSDDSDAEELHQLLHGALQLVQQHVQPHTWQAFWKVVVEGKSPEEAGEELSMSAGAVRVAKSRVLSRLRSELGDSIGSSK